MRREVAYAAVVLLCLPVLSAQPAAPPLSLLIQGTPLRFSPLEVSVPDAPMQPDILANPGFDDGLDPWASAVSEVGSGGHVDVQAGAVVLAASHVQRAGTVFIRQSVAKPAAAQALHLGYDARDEGADPMAIAVLLREPGPNGTNLDTPFAHAATRSMQRYEWTWVPRVAGGGPAEVIIRVRAELGKTQAVRFDNVTLRPGPLVHWSADDGSILRSGGDQAVVSFNSTGSHVIRAEAKDRGQPSWTAQGSVVITNQPPTARLSVFPDPVVINGGTQLDASLSDDADAPVRLADPGFAAVGTDWKVSASEVAATWTTQAGQGSGGSRSLTIGVANAVRNGTLYAYQSFDPVPGLPIGLTVRARDVGAIRGYALLIRATNGTGAPIDAVYEFPPTRGELRLLAARWDPPAGATRATLYLRARMAAGASANVTFDQPRLSAGLDFAWSIDGRSLGHSSTAAFALPLYDGQAHVAGVAVRDLDGATSWANLTLQARDLGFKWDVRHPDVVPLSPATQLDATRTVHDDAMSAGLLVAGNGDFSEGVRGWDFTADETGNGSWSVQADTSGPFAHLRSDARHNGTVYLSQDVDLACAVITCALSFEARMEGPTQVEPILRTTVRRPGEPDRVVDQRMPVPVNATWGFVSRTLDGPTDGVVRIQVFLRMRVAQGDSASIDLRNVRIGPPVQATWTVQTPQGEVGLQGLRAAYRPPGPGEDDMRLDVTSPYAPPGEHDLALWVLPVWFYRTIDGGVAASYPRSWDGNGTLGWSNGNSSWTVGLDEPPGTLRARSFSDGTDHHVRPLTGSGTWSLSTQAASSTVSDEDLQDLLEEPVGTLNDSVQFHAWSTSLVLRLPVADRSVVEGTARVTLGQSVREVHLVRFDDGLVGMTRLPTALSMRRADVSVTLRDGWGEVHSGPAGTAAVPVNPQLAASLLFVGTVAVVLAVGIAMRVVDLRRR